MLNVEEINLIANKYNLVQFNFDTECIYKPNDLYNLLNYIVKKAIPEAQIKITEKLSDDKEHYIATLNDGKFSMQLMADTFSDWLPDYFLYEMESIPVFFNTGKLFCSIDPRAGYTGQDAWYFCGTEAELKAAISDGLPLIYPDEPGI